MLNYILTALVGFCAGAYIMKKAKTGMTTDEAVQYLNNQGYWVKLNAGPDNKRN